ncbi:hypothetical protein [Phenylobacterium zucineum]|uniref:hypothetical protein n=1 Tax=Phenylobacterium zucineum TaxID=284016 RepID=UPI00059D3D25|nr:hypothetical protein [Phenylobacterium zucineum]
MPRKRLLLVAFDLTETTPGDDRYRVADRTLSEFGELFRPVKQIRLLLSDRPADQIRNSLLQKIGGGETVLIARVNNIPAWRITRARQAQWRAFVDAVDAAGVPITNLTRSVQS